MNERHPQLIKEYLTESNKIENVYSEQALEDALASWEYLSTQSQLTHDVVKHAHDLVTPKQATRHCRRIPYRSSLHW